MKKITTLSIVILAMVLGFSLNGYTKVIIVLPPPPVVQITVPEPPDGVVEAGDVSPVESDDVYYDGPWIIGGIPLFYYGGGFFIFSDGVYHFHHMCPLGDRGFYRNHWRHGFRGHHEKFHHRYDRHYGHEGNHHQNRQHHERGHGTQHGHGTHNGHGYGHGTHNTHNEHGHGTHK